MKKEVTDFFKSENSMLSNLCDEIKKLNIENIVEDENDTIVKIEPSIVISDNSYTKSEKKYEQYIEFDEYFINKFGFKSLNYNIKNMKSTLILINTNNEEVIVKDDQIQDTLNKFLDEANKVKMEE